MKALQTFCAAIILTLPVIAHAQGAVIPPSGDKTGKTDGAAINAALTAHLSATLACDATYYTDISIQVPAGANFVGCGYNSQISGVGTITGGIVQLSAPAVDQWATQLVGNFQIIGGTATEAILAGGPKGVGPYIGVHMFNIWVSGGSYTNDFWFNFFFNNQADNLIAGGTSTASAACFHFDGAVNADVFNNLSATCGAPYGFYMSNTQETSGSSGDTFNTLNVEGGCSGQGADSTCAGLFVGDEYNSITFNGFYSENVLHPIVLGGTNLSDEGCAAITFNSPVIGGPAAVEANQLALVHVEDCNAVTFVSPFFNTYPIGTSAPLTFSGGGCTQEPSGVATPNPAGVIKEAVVTWPGAGCTSAPTITVGGGGTGASIVATESGGSVTGLTISAGGSGYKLQSILAVAYSVASANIINPFCPDGAITACWPWIVPADDFPGGDSGVHVTGTGPHDPNWGTIPGTVEYTGYGQVFLRYLDSSGTTHSLNVTQQRYP